MHVCTSSWIILIRLIYAEHSVVHFRYSVHTSAHCTMLCGTNDWSLLTILYHLHQWLYYCKSLYKETPCNNRKWHKSKCSHLVFLLVNHLPQIRHCFSSTTATLSASSYLQVHVQNIPSDLSIRHYALKQGTGTVQNLPSFWLKGVGPQLLPLMHTSCSGYCNMYPCSSMRRVGSSTGVHVSDPWIQ